jgi:hypothetical protein
LNTYSASLIYSNFLSFCIKAISGVAILLYFLMNFLMKFANPRNPLTPLVNSGVG